MLTADASLHRRNVLTLLAQLCLQFYYRWLAEDHSDKDLPPQIDLRGKNVLISGANSGIGKEAAYICALWGARVVLACRDPPPHEDHPEAVIDEFVTRSNGKINKEKQLEWWNVDYSDLSSVRKLGERWISSGRTLDYLFNNAGLNMKNFVRTVDGHNLINQVNLLSHVLLTYLVLPSMKDAKAPRIINTSSCFHYGGVLDFANFDSEKELAAAGGKPLDDKLATWYCASKLKLAMWSKELQSRLSRSEDYKHVISHAVHPGYVNTNVWNSGWMKKTPAPIRVVLGLGLKYIAITPYQGSMAMLWAAFDKSRGLEADDFFGIASASPAEIKSALPDRYTETIGGRFYFRVVELFTRPEVHDLQARARLWQRLDEDIKASKFGLDKVLPGPLPGLK